PGIWRHAVAARCSTSTSRFRSGNTGDPSMRKTLIGGVALVLGIGMTSVPGRSTDAQPPSSGAAAPQTTALAVPSGKLEDALLEWPLPPGERAYVRIDGKRLHRYVEEQAAISRRYRDHGHPKFWGRIIGTSAD